MKKIEMKYHVKHGFNGKKRAIFGENQKKSKKNFNYKSLTFKLFKDRHAEKLKKITINTCTVRNFVLTLQCKKGKTRGLPKQKKTRK